MQALVAEKIFTWARHNSNSLRLFYRDKFEAIEGSPRFQIKLFDSLFSATHPVAQGFTPPGTRPLQIAPCPAEGSGGAALAGAIPEKSATISNFASTHAA
jgi:hypothetical protein